jgi:hypothetical protein
MLSRLCTLGGAAAAAVCLIATTPGRPVAAQVLTQNLAAPVEIGPVQAVVGEPFMMSLCGGVMPDQFGQRSRAFLSLCLPPANTFPSGGAPPYSFWTEFGFPPFGLHLQRNGLISGLPRVQGEYHVPVVVKDLGGNAARILVRITVGPRRPGPANQPNVPPAPLPPPPPPPVEADVPEPPMMAPLLREPERGGPYKPPCVDAEIERAREEADFLDRGLGVQIEAMERLRTQIEAARNESRQKRAETREQFIKFFVAELQGLAKSFTVLKKAVEDASNGQTLSAEGRQQMRELTLAEADWLRYANVAPSNDQAAAVEALNKMTRDTNKLWNFIEKQILDPAAKAMLKRYAGALAGTVWRTARLALENALTTQLMFNSQAEYLELQNSYDSIKWHYDRVRARQTALRRYVIDCLATQQTAPNQTRVPPQQTPAPRQGSNAGAVIGKMILWGGLGAAAGYAGLYLAEQAQQKECGLQPDQPSAFSANYQALFQAYLREMDDWCICNGFSGFSGGVCR